MNPKASALAARLWPWLVVAAWIVAVLAGLNILWRYANTPAVAREVHSQWPVGSQLSPSDKLPTLVMFVHPHCPCTRASIGELAKVAAKCQGRFDGRVVLFKPAGTDSSWEDSDLRQSALEIPGVRTVIDRDGRLARLFNATTSGHTLLFSPSGKLLFSGGITAARGHAGDNVGENAIVSLLTGGATETSRTPVFGCPIIENTP